MSISNERLSDLIGLIYDAAIDPGCWPLAMEAIRVETRAANCFLSLQAMPKGDILLNLTANVPTHYVERAPAYATEWLDVWGGLAVVNAHPINEPAVLSRVNPAGADFSRTKNRYALEWAKPQGLIDILVIMLGRDQSSLGSIAFGRHESLGSFGQTEVDLARLLLPHLQRAATINRLLEMSEVARRSFASVVDALATAVVMVGPDLRVVHANLAARELFTGGEALRCAGGFLTGGTVGTTRALAAAVAQALTDKIGFGHKGLGIPAPDRSGGPGALYVLPLPNQHDRHGERHAAVFYTPQASNFIPPPDLVSALFGLTAAEAKVFDAVAGGAGMPDAAKMLGVAPSTIKTHLIRVFSKTGVRRQADLVKLASSLMPPIRF